MENMNEKQSPDQQGVDRELPDQEGKPAKPPKKKMKTWKKVLMIFFLSLFGLIVAAVLAAMIYLNHLLNQITPYDPANDATLSSSEADQVIEEDPEAIILDPETEMDVPDLPELEAPVDQTSDVNWDNVVNILLVGQDRRPGQGRQRSDSMILVTVNKSKKTITLTSFMRDAHVTIPGYKSNKLNAAYAFGGMSLLNATLEQNYGVHVDGDIEVDFNSFESIIDMLGGVDISLTKKEVNYLNSGMHLTGTDRELHVGTQRLDGEIALAYSRLRAIDSDYRRAERQRTVISALIERYKNQSTTQMLAMLEDILPLVVTNMTKSEIVDYTMDLAPLLAGSELNTLRIPVDGTFRQGTAKVRPGLAAWFQYDIDFATNREVLNGVFAEDDTP